MTSSSKLAMECLCRYLVCFFGILAVIAGSSLLASFVLWDIGVFLIFLELLSPFSRMAALIALLPTLFYFLERKGKFND
jgi:hypothetical protein